MLTEKGHTILTINDILRWGSLDEEIFDYATRKELALITHDRRFGKLYFYSKENPPITIILQVLRPHPRETNTLLDGALNKFDLNDAKIRNKLIIITKSKIRIRSLRKS